MHLCAASSACSTTACAPMAGRGLRCSLGSRGSRGGAMSRCGTRPCFLWRGGLGFVGGRPGLMRRPCAAAFTLRPSSCATVQHVRCCTTALHPCLSATMPLLHTCCMLPCRLQMHACAAIASKTGMLTPVNDAGRHHRCLEQLVFLSKLCDSQQMQLPQSDVELPLPTKCVPCQQRLASALASDRYCR